MKNFSPNMLKTFETCPYKFFLKYVEKISIPQSSKPFEKGKNIHALASYYLSGANIGKFENVLSADEQNAWGTLKSNKYFNLAPVKTEYQISVKVGEFWVGGRLDALVKDDEGNYFILDYKTGSIPKNPTEDFQTIIYLLGVSKFFSGSKSSEMLKQVQHDNNQRKPSFSLSSESPRHPEFISGSIVERDTGEMPKQIQYDSEVKSLSFVYIDLKNNKNEVINFDKKIQKKYEEKIVKICKKIAEAQYLYAQNPQPCEFSSLCNKCNK